MSQTRNEEGPPDYHRPALVDEVVDLIRPVMPGVVIDATFGGGGHSKRMIEEFGEDVKVIGIDRDPEAVAQGAAMGVSVIEANFSDIGEVAERLPEAPAAVLFDFGVSSHQLDSTARGFSYHHEGPLDMRMGPDASTSAAEIVNDWPAEELTRIIRRFGEEPLARRIAAAIVAARPLETTTDLARVIADAMPAARRGGGHPARRVFQAIRIAVNNELEAVASGLEGAIGAIDVGGRVLAISYHSLEDRIVKRRLVAGAAGCTCPPGLPVCGCGNTASLRILTRKPIRASDQEIASNKRARSALLRAAEKVAA